ncbi:hypothetical protein HDV05_004319 [Chytridiales sp. JEL 0842]|nr:hypothetical protein HDV05_004319 [Chytridiales sp. JEL 0842]
MPVPAIPLPPTPPGASSTPYQYDAYKQGMSTTAYGYAYPSQTLPPTATPTFHSTPAHFHNLPYHQHHYHSHHQLKSSTMGVPYPIQTNSAAGPQIPTQIVGPDGKVFKLSKKSTENLRWMNSNAPPSPRSPSSSSSASSSMTVNAADIAAFPVPRIPEELRRGSASSSSTSRSRFPSSPNTSLPPTPTASSYTPPSTTPTTPTTPASATSQQLPTSNSSNNLLSLAYQTPARKDSIQHLKHVAVPRAGLTPTVGIIHTTPPPTPVVHRRPSAAPSTGSTGPSTVNSTPPDSEFESGNSIQSTHSTTSSLNHQINSLQMSSDLTPSLTSLSTLSQSGSVGMSLSGSTSSSRSVNRAGAVGVDDLTHAFEELMKGVGGRSGSLGLSRSGSSHASGKGAGEVALGSATGGSVPLSRSGSSHASGKPASVKSVETLVSRSDSVTSSSKQLSGAKTTPLPPVPPLLRRSKTESSFHGSSSQSSIFQAPPPIPTISINTTFTTNNNDQQTPQTPASLQQLSIPRNTSQIHEILYNPNSTASSSLFPSSPSNLTLTPDNFSSGSTFTSTTSSKHLLNEPATPTSPTKSITKRHSFLNFSSLTKPGSTSSGSSSPTTPTTSTAFPVISQAQKNAGPLAGRSSSSSFTKNVEGEEEAKPIGKGKKLDQWMKQGRLKVKMSIMNFKSAISNTGV